MPLPMRYLRANKGEWGPSAMLFVDTETTLIREQEGRQGLHHVLTVVCASGGRFRSGKLIGRTVHEGTDREGFWQWVESNLHVGETTWLVAHNWGFDCDVLGWRQLLEEREYLLSYVPDSDCEPQIAATREKAFNGLWVDDGPPAICSAIHKSGARLVILDSMNWMPESLERIGEGMGMQKVPLPLPSSPLEKWFRRCRQDVAILERFMLACVNWVKSNRMGCLRYTAAGQSFALYRHRLMPTKIVLHSESRVQEMERDGYYGGRIELYYRGPVGGPIEEFGGKRKVTKKRVPDPPTGPIYELDASGLYPAVMRDGWFPRRLVDWWRHDVHGPRAEVSLSDACLADVLLVSPTHAWPKRTEEGVSWVTGTFRTTLAGPELAAALRLGQVAYCFGYARYELSRLFKDWAEECWSKRIAAEDAKRPVEARLWKYLANSLHGKFAQRTGSWELCPGIQSEQRWGSWIEARGASIGQPGDGRIPRGAKWDADRQEWRWVERLRSIGGQVFRETDRHDADHSFCAIGAWVSALAREKVRDWMELAGRGNVLACHTDALLVTAEGRQRLQMAGQIQTRALGMLREKAEGDTAELVTCGHYRIGDKWCRAGIALRAIELEDGTYLWERFSPLSAAAWSEPGPGVMVYTRHCRPTQIYRKGVLDKSGWIAPHNLAEPLSGTAALVK